MSLSDKNIKTTGDHVVYSQKTLSELLKNGLVKGRQVKRLSQAVQSGKEINFKKGEFYVEGKKIADLNSMSKPTKGASFLHKMRKIFKIGYEKKYLELQKGIEDLSLKLLPIIQLEKLEGELSNRGLKQEEIEKTIETIKNIRKKALPLAYNEDGTAYIRKNEAIPVTLEAHVDGSIYVHFKSKAKQQKDIINQACQKKVYRALNQAGEIVAASVINEQNPEDNKSTFETEKKAFNLFKNCRYVLQGFHVSQYQKKDSIEQKYGLITEYCDGHSDKEFLDRLPLKEKWEFFLHILEGANEMHDKGYIHFDLKPSNIMYKKVNGTFEPRIIDFGVMHQKGEILDRARGAILPPEYRIHESFPLEAREDVDIWALGWYAAENILNIIPNVEYDMIIKNNEYAGKKGRLIAPWNQATPQMAPFVPIIRQMLDVDPTARLPITSAIEQIREKIAGL